jgi:hypothetical protein
LEAILFEYRRSFGLKKNLHHGIMCGQGTGKCHTVPAHLDLAQFESADVSVVDSAVDRRSSESICLYPAA